MIKFAAPELASIPAFIATPDDIASLCEKLSPTAQHWVKVNHFTGKFAQSLVVPDTSGAIECVLLGLGHPNDRKRSRHALAPAFAKLPAGLYHFENELDIPNPDIELLGCLMTGYHFDRYKTMSGKKVDLIAPKWCDKTKVEAMAAAEQLCCDLINTPASDMSPQHLEEAAEKMAVAFGASCETIRGQDLLEHNFPMIHAVGRAAATEPRLIEIKHGSKGPKIALVGKGVCFDTGGLNLKPGQSMSLMKKDMGGAANTLALAHMILSAGLDCQLQVLIPAVENSVSATSFRPGDVLTSRKGLSVEINNTDAEGRLVLADALTYASESNPDLVLSMATLTGAARVAVGPDLAPYYTGSDEFADAIDHAARTSHDPVWRMPFHDPYEDMIEPAIADLDNAPSGGFAGSITAALFLRRFVARPETYTHFDIYGWSPKPQAGRPKGGALQGARTSFHAIKELFDL